MCDSVKTIDFKDDLAAYVLEHSQMLFVAFDTQGKMVFANKRAKEIFPSPLNEHRIDQLFLDFEGDLDIDTLAHNSEPVLLSVQTKNNQPASYLFSFKKRSDGSLLVLGELDYSQTQSINESLFESVNEISNLTRELQKANVELKKLNEIKNQYLGIAAHDLRNPIGTIQGFSEFLSDELSESLSSENLEILEMIHSQSLYMFDLINSFLDYSAIESGKMNVDLKPTDLGSLLKECVDVNQPMAMKKEISIEYKQPADETKTLVDPQKMQQVINNLLSNAMKFSYPKSRITLSLNRSENDYCIRVSDEGQGIPEEDLTKLFKPFSQTSVKSTSGEKSTGLGLSIAKKIIEAHQGTIEAESKVGEGSAFIIHVPKRTTESL